MGAATSSTAFHHLNVLGFPVSRLQTTAIGFFADSADGLIAGQPANTIELKYTLYGDTSLTGSVGFNDFTRLTQHYNQTTGGTWGHRGTSIMTAPSTLSDFTLMTRTYRMMIGSQALPATSSSQLASTIAADHTARSITHAQEQAAKIGCITFSFRKQSEPNKLVAFGSIRSFVKLPVSYLLSRCSAIQASGAMSKPRRSRVRAALQHYFSEIERLEQRSAALLDGILEVRRGTDVRHRQRSECRRSGGRER